MNLLGRRVEREVVGQLLAGARAGRSGSFVVRGQAGIGKSAVMEHVRDTAVSAGFRVEQAMGVESETQFAFSALHQLCAPLLDRAGALPEPQQAALGVRPGAARLEITRQPHLRRIRQASGSTYVASADAKLPPPLRP